MMIFFIPLRKIRQNAIFPDNISQQFLCFFHGYNNFCCLVNKIEENLSISKNIKDGIGHI